MAGKIKYNTELKDIYIGPNPGDAGGAVGSALYFSNKIMKTQMVEWEKRFAIPSLLKFRSILGLTQAKTMWDQIMELL